MVGPYVLGRTLGRGTTGKVKAAQHKDTGLEVAIKIVKKAYVKTHKNKIAREIAVMRLLDHPYVLKLYDVLETSQHIFIVLERVKGGELFDYILQKGRLPRQEALRLIAQIIQGIEFCHMHSICHRDLKPENLLLDENLNIKIADFGMAQLSPDGAALETFCGSPHYGAPEVVSGIRYDGRRSDVWSLGVVFYALITGMLPFDNPNVSTLLKMVKRGVYHMPKTVPEDIADLIRRMLTVDVNERIRTPELKNHRCFYNGNVNQYFPKDPVPSPALEMIKSHPVCVREDLDSNILRDLEGLGWGNSEQLTIKILENRGDGNYNLETIFYQLLAARNLQRQSRDFDLPLEDSPDSPGVVSYSAPNSPPNVASPPSLNSPSTPSRRASVTASPPAHKMEAHKVTVEREKSKEDIVSTPPPAPVRQDSGSGLKQERRRSGGYSGDEIAVESTADTSGIPQEDTKKAPSKFKGKQPLSITITPKAQYATTTGAGSGTDLAGTGSVKKHEYSTTPRFHRLKLINSQDDVSPNVPITPTAKRSWFKSLFRRRPSVDLVGKEHQTQGTSGMYSEKPPSELLKEVSRVLTQMGVSLKIGSSSDYELKCEAVCYLDNQFQIVVTDKAGADIKYRSEDLKEDSEVDVNEKRVTDRLKQLGLQPADSPKTNGGPGSPKTPRELGKPQLIKFTVDIAREASDKVSCVNFNHRNGDLLVYRGLYTDFIKNIHL